MTFKRGSSFNKEKGEWEYAYHYEYNEDLFEHIVKFVGSRKYYIVSEGVVRLRDAKRYGSIKECFDTLKEAKTVFYLKYA